MLDRREEQRAGVLRSPYSFLHVKTQDAIMATAQSTTWFPAWASKKSRATIEEKGRALAGAVLVEDTRGERGPVGLLKGNRTNPSPSPSPLCLSSIPMSGRYSDREGACEGLQEY